MHSPPKLDSSSTIKTEENHMNAKLGGKQNGGWVSREDFRITEGRSPNKL